MIKLSVFTKRRSDISMEAFSRHWTEDHAHLLLSLPDFRRLVRRYVQQHRVQPPLDGLPLSAYDGYAELWFDSEADLPEALTHEAFHTVVAEDEAEFIDRAETRMLVTRETSVVA